MNWLTPEFREGFSVGSWHVEPMLNRIVRNTEAVQVEPKVMQVLCFMAVHSGRTVTKSEFMDEVWADTVVTDDVLARCISELRKILGDDWRDPKYVETIRKTGYRLIAPVQTRTDKRTVLGGRAGERVSASALRRFLGRAQPNTLLAALVVILVLAVAALWVARTEDPEPPIRPSTTPFTSFRGQEVDPAISPDGTRIAFAWNGGSGRHQNLYIKQVDSETPLRITDVGADEWSPAWSPDGRYLAFVRRTAGTYGVYVVPAIGGAVRRIVGTGLREIHSLDWSPDTSRQALAVSLRPARYHGFGLHLLPLAQDTLLPLTAPPAYSLGDTYPAFSRDGSRLAFARGVVEEAQGVYVMDVDGGTPDALTLDDAFVHGIDWLPEGRHVIVAAARAGTAGLVQMPVSGRGAADWIVTASEGSILERPTLAIDAPRLAYAQRSVTANIQELLRAPGYRAYSTRALLASTRWDGSPDMAETDSSTIAFASLRSGYSEIWKTDRDGAHPLQLTTFESHSHSPRWSPDGRMLAFVSREMGDANVYVIDAEGGSPRPITTAPAEDLMPSWSADGKDLYFTSNRSGTWQVWRHPVEGGTAYQVTVSGGLEAQESPDGTAVYLMRPDTTGIWRHPVHRPAIAESTPRVIPAALSTASAPAAPVQSAGPDSVKNPFYDLVIPGIEPADAGNWRVTETDIYYVDRDDDSPVLIRFDLSTGRTYRIATLKNLPFESGLAVGDGGDRILYTQVDRNESDILLVEQFR